MADYSLLPIPVRNCCFTPKNPLKHYNLHSQSATLYFYTILLPPHHFTQSGGEEKYNFFTSLKIFVLFFKILLCDD